MLLAPGPRVWAICFPPSARCRQARPLSKRPCHPCGLSRQDWTEAVRKRDWGAGGEAEPQCERAVGRQAAAIKLAPPVCYERRSILSFLFLWQPQSQEYGQHVQ